MRIWVGPEQLPKNARFSGLAQLRVEDSVLGRVGRVRAVATFDRLQRDDVLAPARQSLADVPDRQRAELVVIDQPRRRVIWVGGVLQCLLSTADGSARLRRDSAQTRAHAARDLAWRVDQRRRAIMRAGPARLEMLVRTLRPIDVVALASFQRRTGGTEITAHNWPRIEPESGRVPFLNLLTSSFAHRPGGQRGWVAAEGGRLVGLSAARPRAGGLVWDAAHLLADEDTVAADLLDEVVACAASHAARRVFLEAPTGGRGQDVARRAAFERFTSSELYVLSPGAKVERTDLFEARPRLRADEQTLFQLYMAAVPAPVRAAEAMTLEEWSALYPGRKRWQPSFTGARQQYVWELGTSMVGWLEVTFGQRSQFMELLVHPRYEDAADRLLRYAMLQVSPKAPVYAVVREYQPYLASALQRAGFRLAAEHELFVKLLAVRVREPRLVTANVVGG